MLALCGLKAYVGRAAESLRAVFREGEPRVIEGAGRDRPDGAPRAAIMNEGFQFLDIILFAMVAAFLVLRLRSVLGRRTGHQPRPPDNMTPRRTEPEPEGNVIELPDRTGEHAESPADTGLADAPGSGERSPLEAGLTQIQIADPSFKREEFLGGARSAFEMVVHAFAVGDTGTLRSLLNDDVFENFQTAIGDRLKAGQTLETTVIGIKSAEVIEAAMHGRNAVVTVKFVSEQVNVTRDTAGNAVDGDPNQVTDVIDIWTFSRNTRSRDPNWKLVETRSPN